jgi:REP element-mobilizing transposase RayT
MRDVNKPKQFYHQKLPHIQRVGESFFITFQLFGSIPKTKIKECALRYRQKLDVISVFKDDDIVSILKSELRRRYFEEIDQLLDAGRNGPKFLANRECAEICREQIHRFDGVYYKLLAYSIMNNHIHLLIDTSLQLYDFENEIMITNDNYQNLDKILKGIKGATAQLCNRVLSRSGQFWERESFDTYIRNEKMLRNVMSYILENPVKAGLVNYWSEYEWSYVDGKDEND